MPLPRSEAQTSALPAPASRGQCCAAGHTLQQAASSRCPWGGGGCRGRPLGPALSPGQSSRSGKCPTAKRPPGHGESLALSGAAGREAGSSGTGGGPRAPSGQGAWGEAPALPVAAGRYRTNLRTLPGGGGSGGQTHLLPPAWGHRAPGPQGQGGGCVWAASPLTPQEGGEKGRLLRPALWLPVSLSFIFSKYHAMNTLCFAPMTKRKPQVLVFKVKINRWNLGLRRGPSPCSRPTSRMRRGLGPAQRLEPHLSSVAARPPPTQAQNKARLLCP